jgi:hypothetical protein
LLELLHSTLDVLSTMKLAILFAWLLFGLLLLWSVVIIVVIGV